jgi:hypothetical protein
VKKPSLNLASGRNCIIDGGKCVPFFSILDWAGFQDCEHDFAPICKACLDEWRTGRIVARQHHYELRQSFGWEIVRWIGAHCSLHCEIALVRCRLRINRVARLSLDGRCHREADLCQRERKARSREDQTLASDPPDDAIPRSADMVGGSLRVIDPAKTDVRLCIATAKACPSGQRTNGDMKNALATQKQKRRSRGDRLLDEKQSAVTAHGGINGGQPQAMP